MTIPTANSSSKNRAMFWRVVRALFAARPGRVAVILLALSAGAAVTAALLNLQVDARRRIHSEFRAFGANVVVAPRDRSQTTVTLPAQFPKLPQGAAGVAFLYTVAEVAPEGSENSHRAVLAGYAPLSDEPAGLETVLPSSIESTAKIAGPVTNLCIVGHTAAATLGIHAGSSLRLKSSDAKLSCAVSQVRTFGGSEDNQIFLPLAMAQTLAHTPGAISLVQVYAPGTSAQINTVVGALQAQLPNLDVHALAQFTETQSRIYDRISGLLSATVILILLLTALCVMAAMTNIAMERKMDVGLMKAVGGATRRVLRFFLAEAALLGLVGGILGAAAGIALSIWLGKAVFGVTAQPRWIVYPVAVLLTVIVAVLGAFPLRRLAGIQPAGILRGEA